MKKTIEVRELGIKEPSPLEGRGSASPGSEVDLRGVLSIGVGLSVFEETYDFITSTEVAEHLA